MVKKIAFAFIIIIIVIIFIFLPKGVSKDSSNTAPVSTPENEPPKVVSTKPNPLQEAIIPTVDKIEITFNRPLENEGELKLRFDPKVSFKVSVSQDRKTGIINFEKPLDLGTSYTLFIKPDTKFIGLGEWGREDVFHFRTIPYKGL